MAVLTDPLLWCVIQVTLVGALAWALCAAVRRWSAPGSAIVPAAALAAVVVLTLCAFAPWPGWWRFAPRWEAEAAAVEESSAPAESPEQSDLATHADQVATAEETLESPADLPPLQTANAFDAPATPASPLAANAPFALPAWLGSAVAALLVIGVVGGLLQLTLGLLSVRSCRRRSRPLDDAGLHELLDILQAELGLTCHIELRECEPLATAATVGWRNPVVLLPPTWRDWTDDQKRAVLAHELAHVAGGDYVACLLAQLGLALHFYHPLVHWLVARLRLEQELAADATAAAFAGGRRTYLTSLAELALHTQERSLGWPAHTFLPTPGTFLRRIEMLRDSKPVTSAAPRRRWAIKWAAVGLLALGAAIIAGLRGGPATSPFDQPAAAQARPAASETLAAAGIDLSYVTNDAKALVVLRPQQALAQEEIRSVLSKAAGDAPPVMKLLMLPQLHQITLIGTDGLDPDDGLIAVLQFSEPTSVDDLAKADAWPMKTKPLVAAGNEEAHATPNDKTLVVGKGESVRKYLANRRKGKPAIAAGPAWEKVQQGSIVAAIDMQAVRDEMQSPRAPQGPPNPVGSIAAQLDALAPLWRDSEYVAAGIILEGKAVHFRAVATCDNADLASDVAETSQAAVTLARNSLRSLREREKDAPALALLAIQTAEGLLKTMKIERSEALVVAQTSTTVPDVKTIAASGLVEAVSGARAAAQRAQSMNNLKQIMLALHNWADVHGGHFPPPVIYGKDGKGKVPHSWRVELLPYLEQAALYEAYKFDEPWDSEANKAVLAKMPAVFRHPAADAKSTYSSYFALTPATLVAEGAGPVLTAFGKRDGVRFVDMLDGTSNTLAVVEAKREIPWTRPDDIVFDPEKPLPELGGFTEDGFNGAFCDGAVRFISGKIDAATLKLLISPQGGEPVPQF